MKIHQLLAGLAGLALSAHSATLTFSPNTSDAYLDFTIDASGGYQSMSHGERFFYQNDGINYYDVTYSGWRILWQLSPSNQLDGAMMITPANADSFYRWNLDWHYMGNISAPGQILFDDISSPYWSSLPTLEPLTDANGNTLAAHVTWALPVPETTDTFCLMTLGLVALFRARKRR